VRIAFTLDCCDREAISWIATTGGIDAANIRDLMVESVERRFGPVHKLPAPTEWLSDNGSSYTAADTRAMAKLIGLVPRTTLVQSPQSNRMAEAFVKTFKRDYASVHSTPDAATALQRLDDWFEHYNKVHPHKALGYRSPREFRAAVQDAPTEPAVGALRRALPSKPSTDGIGSSPPAARSAETRSVWLDASTAVDHH
jgi:putative transposase